MTLLFYHTTFLPSLSHIYCGMLRILFSLFCVWSPTGFPFFAIFSAFVISSAVISSTFAGSTNVFCFVYLNLVLFSVSFGSNPSLFHSYETYITSFSRIISHASHTFVPTVQLSSSSHFGSHITFLFFVTLFFASLFSRTYSFPCSESCKFNIYCMPIFLV